MKYKVGIVKTNCCLPTQVVCKRAFDAKRRGRTKNQVRNHEKLNYINGVHRYENLIL